VDEDLLSIAAERSAALQPAPVDETRVRQAIAALPAAEKDAFLQRLVDDEPRLSLALRQRLGLNTQAQATSAGSRRTVGELLRAAGLYDEDF